MLRILLQDDEVLVNFFGADFNEFLCFPCVADLVNRLSMHAV